MLVFICSFLVVITAFLWLSTKKFTFDNVLLRVVMSAGLFMGMIILSGFFSVTVQADFNYYLPAGLGAYVGVLIAYVASMWTEKMKYAFIYPPVITAVVGILAFWVVNNEIGLDKPSDFYVDDVISMEAYENEAVEVYMDEYYNTYILKDRSELKLAKGEVVCSPLLLNKTVILRRPINCETGDTLIIYKACVKNIPANKSEYKEVNVTPNSNNK